MVGGQKKDIIMATCHGSWMSQKSLFFWGHESLSFNIPYQQQQEIRVVVGYKSDSYAVLYITTFLTHYSSRTT